MTKPVPVSARRIAAAIAIVLPLMAAAADAPDMGRAEPVASAPVMPSPLDPQTESLKAKVMEINSQAQEAQHALLNPPYQRVSVYFGVQTPGLLVNKLVINVDSQAPITVVYERKQSIALLEHGLDRVLTTNLDPGIHRVQATLTGQYTDAKKDDPQLTTTLNAEFKKDDQPAELEIDMFKGTYLSAPHLRLLQWTPKL